MQTLILTPIAMIVAKEIPESSGLVKSRAYPNVYWTHNDSGGEARLYALKSNDKEELKVVKTLNLLSVNNIDWEDVCIDQRDFLYVSDAGNNNQKRVM